MTRTCARIAASLAALATTLLGSTARADGPYRLGPEDQLQVRVFLIKTDSAETVPWAALNGEFTVGADGTLSLPVLGPVQASGRTPAELADAIGTSVEAKVGLKQHPEASVQVTKYRPFFILGNVERPGDYPYRPGLTVVQAVSVAGGMNRAPEADRAGYARAAMTGRGDVRALSAERLGLAVRLARLQAEIDGSLAVSFPDWVKRRSGEAAVATAMREQSLLLDARRQALDAQVAASDQARAMLRQQIDSLGSKGKSLDHQIEAARKELSQVTDLVQKGLTVAPRQLADEQLAASFESGRLDVQIASLKAQQDLASTDREVIDLRTKYRTEALADASDARARLAAVEERLASAANLVADAESNAPEVASDADVRPSFAITRVADGHASTFPVADGDPVAPGDVVRVTLPKPQSTPGIGYVATAQPPAVTQPTPPTTPRAEQPEPDAHQIPTAPAMPAVVATTPALPAAPANLPPGAVDASAASRVVVPDAPRTRSRSQPASADEAKAQPRRHPPAVGGRADDVAAADREAPPKGRRKPNAKPAGEDEAQ